MEMMPPPSEIGQDEDRISALPDELLLEILERIGLHDALRAGAVSRRWRHLPHQLSRLCLDVDDFKGTTPLKTMDAFAGAVCSLLSASPPTECNCDCKGRRAVKILELRFDVSSHHLRSIGRAVEDTVSRGEPDRFNLQLIPQSSDLIAPEEADRHTELGQQFMSFYRACPTAFRLLTSLLLASLEFGDSDLPSVLGACDNLKYLSLESCRLVEESVLKIDVPNSAIQELEFIAFRCEWIELISLPMLREVTCVSWISEKTPLRFGYVPELREVALDTHAATWQAPFALSECFSINTRNLTELYLNFNCQMIWLHPEHPKQLTAIFQNLTAVGLLYIFPECDLSWTLFILEAAPALRQFLIDRTRHCCVETSEYSAEKANLVWEPSKDLKHPNLRLLVMKGFVEEDKVTNYIRLVMELAVGLRTIKLYNQTCSRCNAIDPEFPRRFLADEATQNRIMERLTHGSSTSVEIIVVNNLLEDFSHV